MYTTITSATIPESYRTAALQLLASHELPPYLRFELIERILSAGAELHDTAHVPHVPPTVLTRGPAAEMGDAHEGELPWGVELVEEELPFELAEDYWAQEALAWERLEQRECCF